MGFTGPEVHGQHSRHKVRSGHGWGTSRTRTQQAGHQGSGEVSKDSSWVDQVEKSIRIPSVRTRAAILEILGDPVKPNPNMGRRP